MARTKGHRHRWQYKGGLGRWYVCRVKSCQVIGDRFAPGGRGQVTPRRCNHAECTMPAVRLFVGVGTFCLRHSKKYQGGDPF